MATGEAPDWSYCHMKVAGDRYAIPDRRECSPHPASGQKQVRVVNAAAARLQAHGVTVPG